MTYEEALNIVEELRGHGNAPFSLEQKHLVSEVYPVIMGRRFHRTACSRCWHDAVIEMTVTIRKKIKPEPIMANCEYHMRAGFIIRSPKVGGGRIYTNNNLTNEVAAQYLELFPHKRDMFDKVPEEKPAEVTEEPVQAETEPVQAIEQPKKKTASKAKKKAKK